MKYNCLTAARLIMVAAIVIFTAITGLFAQGIPAPLSDLYEIRYVKTDGNYENNGKSWTAAKSQIQDAINDLVNNGLMGEVWVAAGTYYPTESTESDGGEIQNLSFKIPAGIKVYGGFGGG